MHVVGGAEAILLILRCCWRASGGVVHRLLLLRVVRCLGLERRRTVACWRVMAWRVGLRFGRWVHAHALHQLFEASLLPVCAGALSSFNRVEELAAFAAAVLHKRLNVLLQAFDCILHLGVELASSLETSVEIDVGLVDFAVAAQYRVPLAGEGLVLVLL